MEHRYDGQETTVKYRVHYSDKSNSLSDSLEYVEYFDMIWLTVFLMLSLVDWHALTDVAKYSSLLRNSERFITSISYISERRLHAEYSTLAAERCARKAMAQEMVI